jgi:hypothetical protein
VITVYDWLKVASINLTIAPAKYIITNQIITYIIIVFDFLNFSSSQEAVSILNQAYMIIITPITYKNPSK